MIGSRGRLRLMEECVSGQRQIQALNIGAG